MRASSMKGIPMQIGDYGWIECKGKNENYTGWFLKVKLDGDSYYVCKKDTSFIIADSKIIGNDKNYVLQYKVSAIDALNGDFPNLTKEEMEKRNLVVPIKKEIKRLESEIESINSALDKRESELNNLKDKLYNIEHDNIPVYKLVYGVHTLAADATEYIWVNDKELEIKVGDIVEVNTFQGLERIYVTRLEESRIENDYRTVEKIVTAIV